ncbi:MAG: iron ABC transporter permease [Phycisphaerales bacterium]|nr:iron ABC transporter permease [Phycisphaerales bacterium]
MSMAATSITVHGPHASRTVLPLIALLLLAVGICVLRYAIDRAPGGGVTLAWPEADWAVFRRTSIFAGLIVGGGLGLAGGLMQSLLRNPLASPYLLGVSSGAGLGVMAAMAIAASAGMVSAATVDWSVPAMLGAIGALVVVLALGRRNGWPDPVTVLLSGVVVATICAGGMMLLQHMVPMDVRGRFLTWMMGTLPEIASSPQLILAGVVVLGGIVASVMMSGWLDASLLGDDEARTLGVPIGPLRLVLLGVAGMVTAVTVAMAGPIGFVGLIAPHVARRTVGHSHVVLLPATVLVGVVIVVGADAARQAIDLGSGRLPIGVLTILAGGPVFLWLLRREVRSLEA